MDTRPLRILICSSDETSMQRMASNFSEEGVKVQTSNRLVDHLCFSRQDWDLILVDLDNLNGFLRSLLPAFFRRFPRMPRIGIATKPTLDRDLLGQGYGLELDAYFAEVPRPEELIVSFPDLAAEYLVEVASAPHRGTGAAVIIDG